MTIDHINLARLDLNLLVAFDALMTERSVTRAAARIGIGQSAMSHNLARLRRLFADELLTRMPDGMRPTPRALSLLEPIRTILGQIECAVLCRDDFDPATAERMFRIGVPDYWEVAVIPSLLERLRSVAPGIRLQLRSTDRFDILEELDADRLDLGIGVFTDGQAQHKRRKLFSDSYLCLFDARQTGLTPPLSLDDYVRTPHVLTSLREDPYGVVDQALKKHKRERTIALVTPRFLSVPFILSKAPVITTMPSRLAHFFAETFGLTISPPPLKLPTFAVSLLWHASYNNDPGHAWLRHTITQLATRNAERAIK
jgi:LysR family transcriptional activator of mexEF-oprN operon